MPRRFASLALPLLLQACVSNDNPQAKDDDAGVTFLDATIADVAQPALDAGAKDVATADTSASDAPIDAGPQPVTVTVRSASKLEPGVTVVFEDATGAVLGSVITDASGRAEQVVPAGSLVTTILGDALSPQLVTVVGVEPGDVLDVLDVPRPGIATASIAINSLPAPLPPAALYYVASSGPCESNFTSTPVNLDLVDGCEIGGKFPLLVLATDVNGGPVGYAFKKGNVIAGDGGLDEAGATPLSLGGAWSTATTAQTLGATNAPTFNYGTLAYTEIADGIPHTITSGIPSSAVLDASVEAPFAGHTGYPDAVQSEANITNVAQGVAVRAIATRGAPPSGDATSTFDLSKLLPQMTSATLDATTPARPTATWTSAGSLASSDGAVVVIRWYATTDAGNNVDGSWTIVAPPAATSVRAPALPASASAWLPTADASFSLPPVVMFVEGSFLSGYAQLRSKVASVAPSDVLLNDRGGAMLPALPVDGTLRMTAFTINGD